MIIHGRQCHPITEQEVSTGDVKVAHCSELPSSPGARQTVLAWGARPVCSRVTSELCLMHGLPSQVEFQGPREETQFAQPGSAGDEARP